VRNTLPRKRDEECVASRVNEQGTVAKSLARCFWMFFAVTLS
jgi:hypothetical protein